MLYTAELAPDKISVTDECGNPHQLTPEEMTTLELVREFLCLS